MTRRPSLLAVGAVIVVAAGGLYLAVSPGAGPSGGRAPAVPAAPASPRITAAAPQAGGANAGALAWTFTGAQVASWNRTKSFCTQAGPGSSWQVADGTVGTDAHGNATLATTGRPGSCVAVVSPGRVSAGVVEAEVYFPALPGRKGTIADWTSVWMTNESDWPMAGELDAVEAEPATGVNAVAYHWGTAGAPQEASTDGFAAQGQLPKQGPNLTPGWHTVDIAYTAGSFSVYYDGRLFSSASSPAVTGAPVNLIISTSVTPDTSAVKKQIGAAPVNSDSSPVTIGVKYVKVWDYKG